MNSQNSFSEYSFDLSYLNQVFQGNTVMINQIISMFIKQVPEYIKEMEDCVLRSELSALHPLAHKAKSSIAMLGLKDMESLVLQIEKLSKTGAQFDQLPNLVKKISSECDHIKAQLEEVIRA